VPLAAISESLPAAIPSSELVPVTNVSPVKVSTIVLPPVTISASVCVGTAVPVVTDVVAPPPIGRTALISSATSLDSAFVNSLSHII